MKKRSENGISDHSLKPLKPKLREVSSRFLSPTTKPNDNSISSPKQAFSPVGKKQSHEVSRNGLMFLCRERSCSEFSRYESGMNIGKQNHRPSFGGSTRFSEKVRFSGQKSSPSSSGSNSSANSDSLGIRPGRFSFSDRALNLKQRGEKGGNLDFLSGDASESESDDVCSNNDPPYSCNTKIMQKSGKKVSSRYLQSLLTKPSHLKTLFLDRSASSKRPSGITEAMKKANSLANGRASSSTRRAGLPFLVSEESSQLGTTLFPAMKLPTSSVKARSMSSLLSLGMEFFKGKKSKRSSSPALGHGGGDSVHQLRLMQNRLLQWRYANARAEAVNRSTTNKAEGSLCCAWDSLTKLRSFVLQKKLQLQRKKLEMKLNHILHSQIRPLEEWEDLEERYLLAISVTRDYLHSAVCRVPLVEDANGDVQSVSIAIRHASYLMSSIKSMLTDFAPSITETAPLLSELAELVILEKTLLQECFELLDVVSAKEMEERSLRCSLVQLRVWQQQMLLPWQQQEILQHQSI
ncbi:hypothetical protein Ancab_007889 [Ancistrocladus abbreviatus]